MKKLYPLLFVAGALIPHLAFAQTTPAHPTDLTNSRKSPERKGLLDALRATVGRDLGQPVVFVVQHLKQQGSWAYFHGRTRRADGGEISWASLPADREQVAAGVF